MAEIKVDIPAYKAGVRGSGRYSVILENEDIKEIYGRDNIVLKVFRQFSDTIDGFTWGEGINNISEIVEATKIQNIYSFFNLAPRVYDLIMVKDMRGNPHVAQVTDFIIGDEGLLPGEMETLMEIASTNCISFTADIRPENFIDGKVVDFQGCKFTDYELYKKSVIDGVQRMAHWPTSGTSYQDIGELGIEGKRKTDYRIEKLGLDRIDYKGKNVLDVGCSGGAFCLYASKMGAKRVVGVDFPEAISATKRLANILEYWNIDFIGKDLKNTDWKSIYYPTGIDNFEVVLFLSMAHHIGYPKYLEMLAKDLIVFEGNQRDADQKVLDEFLRWCDSEQLDNTTDLLDRPVYWLRRKDEEAQ